jgi:hypothetical protein
MTIEKTLIISKATRHLTVELPQPVPAGVVDVAFSFPALVEEQNAGVAEGLNLRPTAEQIAAARGPSRKAPPRQRFATLAEAVAEADRRAEAAEADPSLNSLKEFHGIWKDSKTWGQDVDVETEIRKMRDGKKEYWGSKGQDAGHGKA